MNPIYTDAPEVRKIALAAFPGYSGRKFVLMPDTGAARHLHTYWDGGSKSDYALLELATLRKVQIHDPSPSPGAPYGGVAAFPGLRPGFVLVEHRISCGKDMGITIHVLPLNLTPLLGPPAPELPWEQRVVLCVTRCRKSSYGGIPNFRRHEAVRYTGITPAEYDTAKAALISSGHLSKQGGITDKGRNAIGDARLESLTRPQPIAAIAAIAA